MSDVNILDMLSHMSENEKRHRRDLLWKLAKFLLVDPQSVGDLSYLLWYSRGTISYTALDRLIEELVEGKS